MRANTLPISPDSSFRRPAARQREERVGKENGLALVERREPAVLRGVPVGPCTLLWDKDYLCTRGGKRDVKVHVSQDRHMDFISKNFLYRTLPFCELVQRASGSKNANFFISEVMDNFLIQVKGKKKAVLFHPNDFEYLYIRGDKSRVLDVECPDLEKFPKFKKATRYEATLNSGDILFIPALWFHNMTALDFGIAVNVFWRNLDASLYDKNDPYGNKDLIPAAKALASVERATKELQLLPFDCQQFYALKMISQIKETFNLS
ncbi:tRNA wybutosine-synthesizing protein 5-like isoform X3 [Dermacentor albipictus]|uniref:tRNA wybutosine-synthesizing protein 5-like isoform X3 n=1 Tax=Dermacentor albipictus TaxID=60249 RepID=UPI0031FC37FF